MFYRFMQPNDPNGLVQLEIYWITISSHEADSPILEVKIGDWCTIHYENYLAFDHEWQRV